MNEALDIFSNQRSSQQASVSKSFIKFEVVDLDVNKLIELHDSSFSSAQISTFLLKISNALNILDAI